MDGARVNYLCQLVLVAAFFSMVITGLVWFLDVERSSLGLPALFGVLGYDGGLDSRYLIASWRTPWIVGERQFLAISLTFVAVWSTSLVGEIFLARAGRTSLFRSLLKAWCDAFAWACAGLALLAIWLEMSNVWPWIFVDTNRAIWHRGFRINPSNMDAIQVAIATAFTFALFGNVTINALVARTNRLILVLSPGTIVAGLVILATGIFSMGAFRSYDSGWHTAWVLGWSAFVWFFGATIFAPKSISSAIQVKTASPFRRLALQPSDFLAGLGLTVFLFGVAAIACFLVDSRIFYFIVFGQFDLGRRVWIEHPFPLVAPIVIFIGVCGFLTISAGFVRQHRRVKRGYCERCAYDLRGSIAAGQATCPECGSPIVYDDAMDQPSAGERTS